MKAMIGKRTFKIVVVGHVDHGKSTLIGRLLYDTGSLLSGKPVDFAFVVDQLKEEREREMTIDTTQAFFHTKKHDYVIIDAPGHKEFIRNMITGASQAETAILVVDIVEGIQEQFRRHACFLKMLGIKEISVVVNKMDLVSHKKEPFDKIRAKIELFAQVNKISFSEIIPISARNGDNVALKSKKMPWYSGPTLTGSLDRLRKPKDSAGKWLRMPVQDVYDIAGKKRIVGRIESGRVAKGEGLRVFPGDRKACVSGIFEFGKNKKYAGCGENIGLSITEDFPVKRGDMISDENHKPVLTRRVAGNIFWMRQMPFKITEKLVFRCNTQSTTCRISRIEKRIDSATLKVLEKKAQSLAETDIGEVIIETGKTVIIEKFSVIPELGRFILEKNGITVAGGIITGAGVI
ncbi:MAG: GTP-binding protein [Candidatus Omnitrophica bacterium]|nr:GTP-binding protein [Candidatus Omnitrophota bacterium]